MANDWPNSDSGMYSDQILWVKNESLILSFERWCCFDRHFTQSKAVSSSTRAKRTRFGAEGKAIDDGSTGTKRKAPMLCLQTQAALRIVLKDSYHGNLGAM